MLKGVFTVNAVSGVKKLGKVNRPDFKWTDQCGSAAQETTGELFRLGSDSPCREQDVHKTKARFHLENCWQAWSPFLKKDATCLEQVQRSAVSLVEKRRLARRLRPLISRQGISTGHIEDD